MYWSDWGVVPKIERSNLGGTDRTVLLSSGLRRPLGLTIDYDQERLYWVDDDTDTVEMSDLDGGHRDSFSATEPGHRQHALFGIAVYDVSTGLFFLPFGALLCVVDLQWYSISSHAVV